MPCDSVPFVTITPIPMPHRFYGRSISELVEDVQLMKSTVMRQLLDNMYLTNNNRVAVMDGMVNMDDLLTTRPGGIVRTKQPPNQVMQPLQAQPISQQAFPLLSYLDSVREGRTGVSKEAQGLSPDTLNAKTATGVNALMQQTQMRSELIARVFAETGVKDLCKKIFELMVKYQDKEKIIMMSNQYIPVRPTEWKDRFNISIVVGLGTGSKEQQTVMLNSILERQIQAFQLQGGKEMPMVNLKNMYNTLTKIKEMALKYNTQLDTAKIKADADLDKMMVAGDNKILEEAAKSTNMFGKQLQGINESERPGGQVGGNQPIQRSQADIRE